MAEDVDGDEVEALGARAPARYQVPASGIAGSIAPFLPYSTVLLLGFIPNSPRFICNSTSLSRPLRQDLSIARFCMEPAPGQQLKGVSESRTIVSIIVLIYIGNCYTIPSCIFKKIGFLFD